MHVSALYVTIQAFMKWKEVLTQHKVALVADTVQLGLEILIDLLEVVSDTVGVSRSSEESYTGQALCNLLVNLLEDWPVGLVSGLKILPRQLVNFFQKLLQILYY